MFSLNKITYTKELKNGIRLQNVIQQLALVKIKIKLNVRVSAFSKFEWLTKSQNYKMVK